MLTNIAAFVCGLLRLRWYAPTISSTIMIPTDILVASAISDRGYLTTTEYIVTAVPIMLLAAHVFYGAAYSLSLAWIGALPISRDEKSKAPVDPVRAEKMRTRFRVLVIMLLAAIAVGFFVWQATLSSRNEMRAVLAAIGTFAAVGSFIGYHLWFLRRTTTPAKEHSA